MNRITLPVNPFDAMMAHAIQGHAVNAETTRFVFAHGEGMHDFAAGIVAQGVCKIGFLHLVAIAFGQKLQQQGYPMHCPWGGVSHAQHRLEHQ